MASQGTETKPIDIPSLHDEETVPPTAWSATRFTVAQSPTFFPQSSHILAGSEDSFALSPGLVSPSAARTSAPKGGSETSNTPPTAPTPILIVRQLISRRRAIRAARS